MRFKVFLYHTINFTGMEKANNELHLVYATREDLEEDPKAVVLIGWDLSEYDPGWNPHRLFLCLDGMLRQNPDGTYTRLAEDDPSIPAYDKGEATSTMAYLAGERVPGIVWFSDESITESGEYPIYAVSGTLEQLNSLDFALLRAPDRRYPHDDMQEFLVHTIDGQLVKHNPHAGIEENHYTLYEMPKVDPQRLNSFLSSLAT